MNHPRMISILVCVLLFQQSTCLAEPVSATLRVLDEEGHPIPSFEANTSYEWQWGGWTQGQNGVVELDSRKFHFAREKRVKRCEIFIRAPGFAPRIISLDEPSGKIERQVILTKGKPITLTLRTSGGGAIPDSLTPIVFYPQHESLIKMSQRRNNGKLNNHLSEFYPRSVFHATRPTPPGAPHRRARAPAGDAPWPRPETVRGATRDTPSPETNPTHRTAALPLARGHVP